MLPQARYESMATEGGQGEKIFKYRTASFMRQGTRLFCINSPQII